MRNSRQEQSPFRPVLIDKNELEIFFENEMTKRKWAFDRGLCNVVWGARGVNVRSESGVGSKADGAGEARRERRRRRTHLHAVQSRRALQNNAALLRPTFWES